MYDMCQLSRALLAEKNVASVYLVELAGQAALAYATTPRSIGHHVILEEM